MKGGSKIHATAGEAHEQDGDVERAGKTVERVLYKVYEDIQPTDEATYDECVCVAVNAKNRSFRRWGYSP